jgi:hypothetical protein
VWLPKWFVVMVAILAALNAVTHYPDFKEGSSLIVQDVTGSITHEVRDYR